MGNLWDRVLAVITPDVVDVEPRRWLEEVVNSGIRKVGLQFSYDDYYRGTHIDAEECIDWLYRLFVEHSKYNKGVSSEKSITIRESLYAFNQIVRKSSFSTSCHNTRETCLNYLLTIDCHGDVFGCCDAFIRRRGTDSEFCLGNIHTKSLQRILSGSKARSLECELRNRKESCRECKYFPLCNGGCPVFKYVDSRTEGKYNKNDLRDSYCSMQIGLHSVLLSEEMRDVIRKAYEKIESQKTLLEYLIEDT